MKPDSEGIVLVALVLMAQSSSVLRCDIIVLLPFQTPKY